jgi:hypothetical protein
MKRLATPILLLLLCATLTAWAQKPPIRVKFQKGQSTTVLRGNVRGGDIDRYLLSANAGQQMTVRLVSAQGAGVAADIWMPNSKRVAQGGYGTTSWSGRIPETGDCWLVVSTVGKGKGGPYTLEVSIR